MSSYVQYMLIELFIFVALRMRNNTINSGVLLKIKVGGYTSCL
jgi:hypothetical protein